MNRLTVVTTSLLCAALLLGGCAEKRSADVRVAEARASIEIARFRDAIIEMRSLLRERPDYVPARLTLGAALMAIGDMSAAEKELERARQMGASPDDYLELLARAWQSRGNHHEVLADALPDLISDPAQARVIEALRGRSMLALDSSERAAEVFARILSADAPDEARRIALIGEADLLGRSGDAQTAIARLEEALALAPDVPESILALGRAYLNNEQYDQTIELLVAARDGDMQARRKDWFFVEGLLAEAYLAKNDLENARAATETLLEIGKAHPMSSYLHGRVELKSGNVNEAIQYFQVVLANYPGYAPALTLMGVALIELDDMDQAEMHLSEAVARDPANIKVRRLLAETRMRMGRSRAAIATLQAGLRSDTADASMITLLGRESLRIGKRDDGLRYLREALAEDPDNLRANLALAEAYLADGQSDAAVAVLNALPNAVLSPGRRDTLVRIAKIDRKDPATAATQIEDLLREAPDDPFVMGLAGGFYNAVGEPARARALFEKVLSVMPGNRSAMLGVLELDEREGNFDRSRALFSAANAAAPDDLMPLLVLARIHSALGDEAAAIAHVREALEKHPGALLPNLILAAQAMRESNLERAEQLAGVAVERYPKSARAHALMGLIRMRQSRFDEASARFRRAVLSEPSDAEYRYYLGQADLANERVRQARTSFQDALTRNENHLGALRAIAVLDAIDGKTGLASQYIERIRKAFGFDWSATVAVADIRAVQGQTDEALALYEQAQAEQPSWAVALELYRLRRAARRDDPTQSLRAWLRDEPAHLPALITLGQYAQQQGKESDAIGYYERALAIDADNVLAANNVAWLYLERDAKDDRQRALEVARIAYNAAPESISIADTYGWMLHNNGEREVARSVLQAALAVSSPDMQPDIAFHLATTLYADGKRLAARDLLDEALRATVPFASREQAEALRGQMP